MNIQKYILLGLINSLSFCALFIFHYILLPEQWVSGEASHTFGLVDEGTWSEIFVLGVTLSCLTLNSILIWLVVFLTRRVKKPSPPSMITSK